NFAPVMIGAPYCTAGEARLVSDSARGKVAAERDARHADAAPVDVWLLFEPVDCPRRPAFRMRVHRQSLQPQGFARAGLIDAERGDPATGEFLRQFRPVEQLLAAIEAVA